jgi:hypothetical protein
VTAPGVVIQPAAFLAQSTDEPKKDCPRVNGQCVEGTFVDKDKEQGK